MPAPIRPSSNVNARVPANRTNDERRSATRRATSRVARRPSRESDARRSNADRADRKRGKHAAEEWADDRDRSVAPVRAAFAGDRQQRVHEPRTEIARRVDRIAGRPAERHTDAPYQKTDE